jgi:putative lipoprotein
MTEEKPDIPEEVEQASEPIAEADQEAAALAGEQVAEEAAPAEEQPEGEKRTDWPRIVVGVIGAILLLCIVATCIAATVAIFSGGGAMASVTGNVVYRERMALPDDAVVTVQLRDVSLADAPAKVLDEQVIKNPGQVPIPYEVQYDESEIDDRHTYAIYARIDDGQGNLMFTTTQSYPVITRGNPTEDVEVLVERAGGGPAPTPQPTPAPAEASIRINDPNRGDVLDISGPVTVRGTGANLYEGNVVVQALDGQGNVLDQQPTTLTGRDVGSGGMRAWSVDLNIQVEPGTVGRIFAFSPSPKDGSIMASDQVEVTYGQSPAVDSFIKIDEPGQGAVLDIERSITIGGSGGGLFEGNVVVQVLDAGGNVLAEQATTAQGEDVGVGGPGTWSMQVRVDAEPGTPGKIYAFSPSPKDGSIMASDEVEVIFGQAPSTEAFIKIAEPAAGAILDVAQPIRVSGTGGGLHEGNLVVLALDEKGNVLAQRPATLQGDDVGTGGEGTWATELTVDAGAGAGYIAAVSTLPTERQNVVASDHVQVTFEQELTLEGVSWVLARTIAGTEITAIFDGGRVSGSAGCNNYFGTYVTSSTGGQNTLSVSELGATRMMCAEEIMEQEAEYLAALQSATNYSIDGATLEIISPDSRLTYSAK